MTTMNEAAYFNWREIHEPTENNCYPGESNSSNIGARCCDCELFVAAPEKYAPAYGGWCAYGVAEGYAAETDPVTGWTIDDGRLYLNWDVEVSADWRTDKAGYLKKSEPNWSTVQTQLQEGGATVYWHGEQ